MSEARVIKYATEAEWLAARMEGFGITGTQAAAILLADTPRLQGYAKPWEVWCKHKHPERVEPLEPAYRLWRGHALEPVILRWYAETHGVATTQYDHAIAYHAEHPWLRHSLDGVDALGRVWEVKTTQARHPWPTDGELSPNDLDFPRPDWIMQAVNGAVVLGSDKAGILADVGYGDPRCWTIQVSERLASIHVRRLARWRDRYLLGDDEPPADGSQTWRDYASELRPTLDVVSLPSTSPDAQQAAQWARHKRAALAHQKAEKLLRPHVERMMLDVDGIDLEDGGIRWGKRGARRFPSIAHGFDDVEVA